MSPVQSRSILSSPCVIYAANACRPGFIHGNLLVTANRIVIGWVINLPQLLAAVTRNLPPLALIQVVRLSHEDDVAAEFACCPGAGGVSVLFAAVICAK